jgi:hypothetical protein
MCRLANFSPSMAQPLRAGRHRGEEPDHPGASSWSSACKDNIGTPVLRCSKAASKNLCGVAAASASCPHSPTDYLSVSCSAGISSWPELDLTRIGEALFR